MKTLIENYQHRLNTITEIISNTLNTGSINDEKKMARLSTEANEYRTFISELEKFVKEKEKSEKEDNNRIDILCRLYYRYKRTTDNEIREHLKRIKVVRREKHAGGKITKYYPLNQKAMKKIKDKPRNVSLTFDATEINTRAIGGLEEYKTVMYLCKSTSRFFLKPDIGEIFDALDFRDIISENTLDAICFLDGYETLPNTDGEHHLMQALLLTKFK